MINHKIARGDAEHVISNCCLLELPHQKTLEKYTEITPMEIIKGGSLGQGTAVNGEFDLDLVIIAKSKSIRDILIYELLT